MSDNVEFEKTKVELEKSKVELEKAQLELEELKKSKEKKNDDTVSSKSRLVAALLCYFLGVFGVHRFYLGRTTSAILQILFGWATLFIWNLVDLILILCGTFKDKDGKAVKNWQLD